MKKLLLQLTAILTLTVFLIVISKSKVDSSIIAGVAGVLFGMSTTWITKTYKQEKSIRRGIETVKRGKPCFIEELEIVVSPDAQDNTLCLFQPKSIPVFQCKSIPFSFKKG